MTELDDAITAAWQKVAADRGLEVPERTFTEILKLSEREASRHAKKYLQPWLRIVEEQIYWLGAFYFAWRARHDNDEQYPFADRAPFELLGTVANYAVGVRRLVLSGLDFPARAVLRPLTEAAYTALVLLADETLRREYVAVDDEEKAQRFWFKRLTSRQRAHRLEQIEIACNIDETSRTAFAEFRRGAERWLSQFIHPNNTVAFLSTRAWSPFEPDMLRPAVFGRCNMSSSTTLSKTFRTLWYFSLLFYVLVTTGHLNAPRFKLDVAKSADSQAQIGFDVILSLAITYWDLEDDGYETEAEP